MPSRRGHAGCARGRFGAQRRDVPSRRHPCVAHPLRGAGYFFDVPLLAGEHVTEDTGTGFVHTAPGHGTEDFEIWEQNRWELENRKIDTTIPFTVNEAAYFTAEARGFEGKRVVDDKGKFGDANDAVIKALIEANALIARSRHKHDYPAFLALEEAGDLPRHPAMVHRHGPGPGREV